MEKSGFRKEEIFEKREAAKKAAAKKLEEESGITENKPRSKKQAKKAAKAAKGPITDAEMSVMPTEEIEVAEFEPAQAIPQIAEQTEQLANEQITANEQKRNNLQIDNIKVDYRDLHELAHQAAANDNKVTIDGLMKVTKRTLWSKIGEMIKGVMFAYKKQEKLKMGGSEGKVEIPDESIEQI